MIREIRSEDAEAVSRIYNYYIESTIITFEEQKVSQQEMLTRINGITQTYPWLVYQQDNKLLGYAYAGRWKDRSAYRYAVEAAIYLDQTCTGQGIGSKLINALLMQLKQRSIHCVIAGIALPNPASIALFEKFGFKNIGQFPEVGFKFNQFIDVGYWILLM